MNNIFTKKIFRRLCGKPNSYLEKKYILEPAQNYFTCDEQARDLHIDKNVYLEGYWQSYKYFDDIANDIRNELSFVEEPDEINRSFIQEMAKNQSVCIHIRHGDNANHVAKSHGVLSLDYYKQAITKLTEQIKDPVFYVFSDDPKWARENLILDYPTVYISHNGDEKNYEDLRLMTHCKHHIIGNSTFSWWGAWLGKKDGQLVYAPKYYHVNVDISRANFYPPDWHILHF